MVELRVVEAFHYRAVEPALSGTCTVGLEVAAASNQRCPSGTNTTGVTIGPSVADRHRTW
jgi:hypothetical protein